MTISALKDRFDASKELFGKEVLDVEGFVLLYPRELLTEERLERACALLGSTRHNLEEALSLRFNDHPGIVICGQEGYLAERGLLGKAFPETAFVQLDPARFSHFAGTFAHELAHVLSQQLGRNAPPVLREGIACYAAEVTDAAVRPMGMPLHFHLVWMLGVGLRPTLQELWERRDYAPEMYDLGWSLTTFLIETHSQECFYDFYRSDAESLAARTSELYGKPRAKVEREWYEYARAAVTIDYRKISRMDRSDGWTCSQAAWVSAN